MSKIIGTSIRTGKEFVRHIVHKLGFKRGLNHLRATTRGDRFSEIYSSGVWQRGNHLTPGSGEGSSLDATQNIRAELPSLLRKLSVDTLIDVGCGDFTWMSRIAITANYIGADIVPSVIEKNRTLYGSQSRHFIVADAVADSLPDADTILCREVLFHLSFADGKSLVLNSLSKRRKHFIATSDTSTWYNSDIETGDFRVLNLQKSPFFFPEPLAVIADEGVWPGRMLAAWDADAVRRAIAG